jgi:RNA polymerase sigma factor (sigma-70 family)
MRVLAPTVRFAETGRSIIVGSEFQRRMARMEASPLPIPSDAELIRKCLSGEDAAWSTLVDRYQRLVYSVAMRCGLSEADADDVFQIVFTTLFRRLHALRDESRLASWLITTAQRESWRVAKRGSTTTDLDDAMPDPSEDAAAIAEASDRDQRVRDGMSRLDERCRALLTALFLAPEERSYGEISSQLGIAIGSIGPTRARCFKKLETLLRAAGLS